MSERVIQPNYLPHFAVKSRDTAIVLAFLLAFVSPALQKCTAAKLASVRI